MNYIRWRNIRFQARRMQEHIFPAGKYTNALHSIQSFYELLCIHKLTLPEGALSYLVRLAINACLRLQGQDSMVKTAWSRLHVEDSMVKASQD